MNLSMQENPAKNELNGSEAMSDAERTLRLIAALPAPEGLEERVKAGLRVAPRQAKVMLWPFLPMEGRRWMQRAATAAIVLVIAGGGWGVYSHIQPAPLPTAVSAPQPLNGGGGFNAAAARRVPQTLQGPVVSTPALTTEKVGSGKSDGTVRKHGKRSGGKKSVEAAPTVR